jgi:hypothetical protein
LSAEEVQGRLGERVTHARPSGLLFHAGVGEGEDFFTVSVREGPEAYEAFASRFKEALGSEGFEGGAPKILPVHHTIDDGVSA